MEEDELEDGELDDDDGECDDVAPIVKTFKSEPAGILYYNKLLIIPDVINRRAPCASVATVFWRYVNMN